MSKINNIYVTALYDLGEDFQYYRKMWELSSASVLRHLPGISWQVVLRNMNRVREPHDMFREVFYSTYRLWYEQRWNHANVFFVDVDVLFVKPVEMFGRFGEFRMFTSTDPPRSQRFDPYFACGVRYFPHTMAIDLWDVGFEMFRNPDSSIWDYEQVIYNEMFYAQGIEPEIIPDLNYIAASGVEHVIPRKDAAVLHFVSSRGAEACLDAMEEQWRTSI